MSSFPSTTEHEQTRTLVVHGSEGLDPPRQAGDPEPMRWFNPPQCVRLIQNALLARDSDQGRYAVLAHMLDGSSRFMTPTTHQGAMFWTNGLDDVAYLHECIALFDGPSDAYAAMYRWDTHGLSIFRVELHADRIQLVFEGRANRQ